MKDQDLSRKLILRAPPDLVAAIYTRVRREMDVTDEAPSWPEIVRAAQGLGIFTTEEAHMFLQLVAGHIGDAA